jgi:hypothetical protein
LSVLPAPSSTELCAAARRATISCGGTMASPSSPPPTVTLARVPALLPHVPAGPSTSSPAPPLAVRERREAGAVAARAVREREAAVWPWP